MCLQLLARATVRSCERRELGSGHGKKGRRGKMSQVGQVRERRESEAHHVKR
jgi:hypothetical protein